MTAATSIPTVFAPLGELDVATAPHFERALVLAHRSGVEHVIVDLSGVQFVDSSGLHALFRAHALFTGGRRRFALRPGPSQVQRVLGLVHVDSVLPFDSSDGHDAERLIPVDLTPSRTAKPEAPPDA